MTLAWPQALEEGLEQARRERKATFLYFAKDP